MDVFDTLRGNLEALIAKWREANSDGKLEAKEVGALVILAGQSVAWTIGVGKADGLAIQTAAERLFDEVLAPFVLEGVDKVRPKSPWWKNWAGIIALGAMRRNVPEARAYYVQFISGALQAIGLVIVTERTNAQRDAGLGVPAIPIGALGAVHEFRPYSACLTDVGTVRAAIGC